MNNLPGINNTTALQIFQITRYAGFFITGVLLVKSGTPVALVGTYEKLMFLGGIVSYFWVQGIVNSLLANYADHRKRDIYLFNVFVLMTLASVVVFVLLQLFRGPVSMAIADGALPGYRYLCLYILFNSPCFLIETIYILKKKALSLICYGFISMAGTTLSIAVPVIMGYSIETAIAALTLWTILRYFWLLKLILKNSTPNFNPAYIKEHFQMSAPLIVSFLIAGSADYIDGLMVTFFFGPALFAIFRYGAKELPLSLLMANAVSTSMIPVIKENVFSQESIGHLKQESTKLMNLLYPVSIILLFASPWLYPLVFNHHFSQSASIFNIYILLIISRTLLPQSIIYAKNGASALLKISIAEIIFNIVMSYSFMLKMGLAGIAWGTIAAHYFEKILMCLYLYKYHAVHPQSYIPRRWLLFSSVLVLAYIFA